MGNAVFISIQTNICISLSEGNSATPNRAWAEVLFMFCRWNYYSVFSFLYRVLGHVCSHMIHVSSISLLLSSMTFHPIVGVITESRYNANLCFGNRQCMAAVLLVAKYLLQCIC